MYIFCKWRPLVKSMKMLGMRNRELHLHFSRLVSMSSSIVEFYISRKLQFYEKGKAEHAWQLIKNGVKLVEHRRKIKAISWYYPVIVFQLFWRISTNNLKLKSDCSLTIELSLRWNSVDRKNIPYNITCFEYPVSDPLPIIRGWSHR